MQTVRTIGETREAIATAKAHGKRVGFVPTLGFLHDGHLSLVDEARRAGAELVVVSIFVNPKQFGPNEDFARYPRDESRDRELLERRGADLLFLPSVDDMYPAGSTTLISVGAISRPLEGERRPGHFEGVATVVMKLFNIVQPDLAVFGRKDAQQCAVIERMVRDLDVPVELIFGETTREHDGLAMSSRNSYLSVEDRKLAPALHRALRAGEEAIVHGVEDAVAVESLMLKMAAETPAITVDYLAVVDPETFEPPLDFNRDLLLAGAVRLGKTRLIDNIRIDRKSIPHTRR
ncbi:MAG: pantoate--beta-alanine ligase [Thermoanaerobaculia bacterium]|nr:pantoate--beta-alanine ligase [Thermoanaerobaculia bacterium]